jgi:hypothetical protein
VECEVHVSAAAQHMCTEWPGETEFMLFEQLIRGACPSVCMHENSKSAERFFMKFDIVQLAKICQYIPVFIFLSG